MKAFVLLAILFFNGEQESIETTFYDTHEQCMQRAERINVAAADWSAHGLSVRADVKCHKITPEVASDE